MRILLAGFTAAVLAGAGSFTFSTGDPDGLFAAASRPGGGPGVDIETADDFILAQETLINSATFTGLIPSTAPLTNISSVGVEIYRVFPLDSTNPPSGNVPTRVNSPSDVEFDDRSSLAFVANVLSASFSAGNSVLNGINKSPNQTTNGEGVVSGQEVEFDVTFSTPFDLPAGHYFFVPQVLLSSGDFFWLSAPRPITGGTGPFSPDLQAWIRNANLAPDWLRIGTDIVGGTTPPTYNMTFSLDGTALPEPATFSMAALALVALGAWRRAAKR
ncbi:MAG: PEP-CTERM sorting domain-containing protein [Acidobacteriia bacterium]|nr:PEP-CTERM sorting domain-containing protein [Terriglobia bacterium]